MSFANPKSSLSQNFLVDQGFQRRIVDYGRYSPSEKVVEIGPGYGAITAHLLELACNLDLIEIDPDAVEYLRSRFVNLSPKINQEDVLRVDFSKFGNDLRLIGNLPYHISSPILLHVHQYRQCIKDVIFMLQKEVVDRLVASPGEKAYGRLSIALGIHWDIERLFDVPPDAFRPVPKVWSSVVCMQRRKNPPVVDETRLDQVLTTAFSKRRKTLRNALKGVFTEEELVKCSIDPQARPENLSIDQYVQLANF